MNIREKTIIFFAIKKQQLITNIYLAEAYLFFLIILSWGFRLINKNDKAIKLLCQAHRTTRFNYVRRLIEPTINKNLSIFHNIADRIDNNEVIKYFGTRIMVLKPPSDGGEKGVLYIMFSELFKLIPRTFDMSKLLNDYILVFEPSWSGYCDEDILHYTKYDDEIYLLAAEEGDYQFLTRLKSNLKPLTYGPCDWIDPIFFEKYQDKEKIKKYDIVMNSHWGWSKRHHVLFRILNGLQHNVKIAMIGRPWKGRGLDDLKKVAAYYGVQDKLDFYEDIPYEEVIRITSISKLGMLLSLKEGSNRAMSEALFCNIPVIVLAEHVGGIRKNVNKLTGKLVPQNNLKIELEEMLDNLDKYSPKEWASKNISCIVTGNKLNNHLKNRSNEKSIKWTRDIVIRTNSPESKYFDEQDEIEYKQYNAALTEYLQDDPK